MARMGISPSCVCAEPLDARGCGSLHHMPSRQERPTVSLLRLRRADHRGRNRSRTRRRIVARVLGPRPERLSICGAGLCPPEPLIRLRIAASSNADVLEPDGDRLAVRNYLYPYARVIARALAARVAEGFWVRFAPDSPVEGGGFEPSVPRGESAAVDEPYTVQWQARSGTPTVYGHAKPSSLDVTVTQQDAPSPGDVRDRSKTGSLSGC